MQKVEYLKPSEIRFSQDTISNKFSDAIQKMKIGDALDKIYAGDQQFLQEKILANMKVGHAKKSKDNALWFTVNNRSLWVLKELELLGKLNGKIKIQIDTKGIEDCRFTTENEGKKILVRQKPVGGDRAKPAPFWAYQYTDMVAGGADYEGADDGYNSDDYYI